MKTKLSIYKIAVLLLIVLGFGHSSSAQFKVIGYAPSWAQTTIQYSKLTHINYAFALPQYGGRLKAIDNPAYLQSIVSSAHANGVKVFIAIGGWSDNGTVLDPVFESIGGDAGSRANLVNDALYLVNTYNLDGVDIDWEYPDPGNSSANFTALLRDLSNALRPKGKGLSFAGAADSYSASGIGSDAFQYVDHVNIMAYDGPGANHSTYQFAVDGVNLYKGKGCPASKCVLGVPFYARPSWNSYAQLLANGANPNSDFFGSDGYNGIPTIKQKTTFALQNAAGIMIWELAMDATGANSLLSAINDVVKSSNNNNNNNTGSVATFYKDCNYGGYAVGLAVGDYNLGDLNAKGILNDDISSIKINAGYEVQLFWDANFAGSSTVIGNDNTCLVNNGWNDQASSLKVRATGTSGTTTTIQAESFGAMAGVQTEGTTDAGGGSDVGYIDAGDWMAYYNINFPTSGTYTIQYRVASISGSTLSMDLNAGSIQLGSANIPATGGWQNWTTISQNVTVNAGTYNVGIYAQAGGWNINWFSITKSSGARVGTFDAQPTDVTSDYNLSNGFEVSPNPVLQELSLSAPFTTTGGNIQIVSGMGTEVFNGTFQNALDVSNLSVGIYTLIYTKDGNKIVKRFIKQ